MRRLAAVAMQPAELRDAGMPSHVSRSSRSLMSAS